MHKTKNDLPDNARNQAIALLNERLADAIDLHYQAKQAHWNVKGTSFIALHELFDKVAGMIEEYVDLMAERATALGGVAEGTVPVVAKRSTLRPYPLDIINGRDHVDALSDALATFGRSVRKAIEDSAELGDADTTDLFTEISRKTDENLWLVEAHLQADR
jgi:starvation-inducible DNA-binding protein